MLFSLEMSRDQLAQRMLCAEAKIDAHKLRRGFLSQEEWQKLTRAVGPLSESPLYIDDSASLSVMEVRAKARRLKSEKGLEAVFVDYLQLMRGFSRAENRQQELSEISRSLKALAKELSIPVIALSQLSRPLKRNRRPILSDLMESGALKPMRTWFSLFTGNLLQQGYGQGNYYGDNCGQTAQRPVGTIELDFQDHYNRFVNIARAEELHRGWKGEPDETL